MFSVQNCIFKFGQHQLRIFHHSPTTILPTGQTLEVNNRFKITDYFFLPLYFFDFMTYKSKYVLREVAMEKKSLYIFHTEIILMNIPARLMFYDTSITMLFFCLFVFLSVSAISVEHSCWAVKVNIVICQLTHDIISSYHIRSPLNDIYSHEWCKLVLSSIRTLLKAKDEEMATENSTAFCKCHQNTFQGHSPHL